MSELLNDCRGMLGATDDMFRRSASALTEADSDFAPSEGAFTVAQQVAHAAHTVEWFLEGAFSESAFDLDFESQAKRIAAVDSLDAAWAWWGRAVAAMAAALEEHDEAAWSAPIAAGPILSGAPRWKVIGGVSDHTAHHRGALTVYARLLGRVPPMPYAE